MARSKRKLLKKRRTRKQKGGNKLKLIVKLTGGLGNRFFQIMAGLGFAEKYDMDVYISNNYTKWNHIPEEESINQLLSIFSNIKLLDKSYNNSNMPKLDENIKPTTDVYIDGYFNSDDYFPKKLPKLNLVEPVNNLIKNINKSKLFFIHFRLGDYTSINEYKLNDNYYINCINKIKKEINKPIFIIISNDINESKKKVENKLFKYLKTETIIYDTNENRLDSLYYMCQCRGGICANSTFSWMGAYSISNKSGLIFMPYPWFNMKYDDNIYPSWVTKIDVNQIGGNKNKKIIVKSNKNGGFFSNFNKLITYLKEHNNENIVEIGYDIRASDIGDSLPFMNKDVELFNKLFEPYNENKQVDETVEVKDYENYEITFKNAYNYYNENRYKLQPYNDVFKKYIKLKPNLNEKLNKLINELRADCEQVIGIFVRSNALSSEQPNGKMPTYEDYSNAIDKIDKTKKTKYFLRIDNEKDLEYYKNKYYPNYQTSITRSKDNIQDSLHVSNNKYLLLDDLENTYLEVALLSVSDILVHCVSNMATASLYMNMNQKSICVSKN